MTEPPLAGSGAIIDRGATLAEIDAPDPTGLPLVAREGSAQLGCVAAPAVALPVQMPLAITSSLVLDGETYFVWAEALEEFGALESPIRAARIALDGTLGTPGVVFEPPPEVMYATLGPLVAGHGRLTLAWDYTDANEPTWLPVAGLAPPAVDPSSGLVQLDADAQPLAPLRTFDQGQFPFHSQLIATRDGYLAAWSEPVGTQECALRIARLDQNLNAVGPRKTLATLPVMLPQGGGNFGCYVIDIVETTAGLALAYSRTEGMQQVDAYQAFDGDDQPLGPATRIATSAAFYSVELLAVGDEVLATWVFTDDTVSLSGFDTELRVARFGADGALASEVATIAAAAPGDFSHRAIWLDLGDAVGLAWSREQAGDPSCTQGCVSVGFVHYFMFDPTTFAPRSTLLELTSLNAAIPAGFTGMQAAGDAQDVLFLVDHWNHTSLQSGQASRSRLGLLSIAVHCAQ